MKLFQDSVFNRFILILLFTSLAILISVADRTPAHLEKRFPNVRLMDELKEYTHGVVDQTVSGPYVYRVLVPYSVKGISQLLPMMGEVTIDYFLKVFILFLCQISFFVYMRNIFSSFESLFAVLWLDYLVGFSLTAFQGPSVIETGDLFNLAVFIISLILIRRNSTILLYLLLFIGTFNRETTWFILPIVFLNDFMLKKGITRSLAVLFAIALPYFGLRFGIHTESPSWFIVNGISRNIPFLESTFTFQALSANLHFIALIGPLLFLAIIGFKDRPQFLKIAASVVPLFIIMHYFVGLINEFRIWIPLYVLLIPLAVDSLRNRFTNII